jgi:rare lipoprotein A
MIDGASGVESTQGGSVSAVGPAADYPMVLGEPFTVEGELYTPADTLNYDAVGYAGLDEGAGVTAAHRTLPLPSYAEVTSLDSGKTILVRIERRGPMTGHDLVSLSPAAAAQLGVAGNAAVRVRRVNPTEAERAELRALRSAPERMETPKSLVEVLRRKLPAAGAASLAVAKPDRRVPAEPATVADLSAVAPPAPRAVTAYPLPQLGQPAAPPKPVVVSQPAPATRVAAQAARPTPAPRLPVTPTVSASPAKGAIVVQAGAFASRANADRAAKTLGGFVTPSGRYFRVRTGPFTTRGQADAALAKVKAAGYSDARVTTPD